MKSKAATVALLAAMLVNLAPVHADARQAERLSRPVPTSATGPGGALVVSGDATFGNLVVDQYAALGRKAAAPGSDPQLVAMLANLKCAKGPINQVSAYAVAEALKGASKDERARLKARDPASMTALAAGAVATLDGVNAEAVRADEALGPGVYHDAIAGMRTAIVACKFFGQKL